MTKSAKRNFGDWGEEQASLFLIAQGYSIIERNYRVRQGEIDIIAWHDKPLHGRTLCFIEVKTRTGEIGSAERATDYWKLQNIFFAARAFCKEKNILTDTTPIQFEQVSVYLDPGATEPSFKHDIIPVT